MTDDERRTSGRVRDAGERRHRGREAAVEMLYQWEIGRTDFDEVLRTFWTIDRPGQHQPSQRVREFAARLARGTISDLERIDTMIAGVAEHWRLSRMAVVDRLILRLAVYELASGETPPNVVINEALELARTFSTDEAVKFINGMLDAIKRRMEKNPSAGSSRAADATKAES